MLEQSKPRFRRYGQDLDPRRKADVGAQPRYHFIHFCSSLLLFEWLVTLGYFWHFDIFGMPEVVCYPSSTWQCLPGVASGASSLRADHLGFPSGGWGVLI